jgi:hypothetical protein
MGEKLTAPSSENVDDAPVPTSDEEMLKNVLSSTSSAPLLGSAPFIADVRAARQHAMDANRPPRTE